MCLLFSVCVCNCVSKVYMCSNALFPCVCVPLCVCVCNQDVGQSFWLRVRQPSTPQITQDSTVITASSAGSSMLLGTMLSRWCVKLYQLTLNNLTSWQFEWWIKWWCLHRFQLDFIDFDLEESDRCLYDSLTVLEDVGESEEIGGLDEPFLSFFISAWYRYISQYNMLCLAVLCGASVPPPVLSHRSVMVLHFTSDSTITHRGFKATLTFISVTGTVCPCLCVLQLTVEQMLKSWLKIKNEIQILCSMVKMWKTKTLNK